MNLTVLGQICLQAQIVEKYIIRPLR